MSDADATLLIDRAATARRLDANEVRDWGSDQRVFVSSVMDGFDEPRLAAAGAIEDVGAEPVMFERFGGRDSDPNAAYLAEVQSSSIYVGLLGARYGRPLPSRFSATHEEYLHAERHGLRLSVWTQDGVDREGHQQSFLEEVQVFNVTGGFADPDALRAGLAARLERIAAEDLSPWCKIGRCLFRARQVSVGGGTAVIEASIRDDRVADELASFDTEFGPQATTFAYWAGVYDARVTGIASVSRSGRSREVTINLDISQPPTPTRYSFNGVGYDDGTELAIRVSWLGEENPLGAMSYEAEIPNPFAALAELQLPEEALRPIAWLLALDILARARDVARVDRFRLGPSVGGRRRFAIAWTPKREYANQPDPDSREVVGEVAL